MLDRYARWIVDQPMAHLASWLSAVGISPNVVTLTGFLLTVISALLIAQGRFVVGGFILGAAALMDMLDGTLARLTRSSTFGAFLDSTLDRYSESITFLALAFYYINASLSLESVLTFVTIVGSLMVSYTRARAEGLNVECKVGFLQRPERIVLIIVGLLTGGYIMLPVLWLLAVLTNFTTLQRIYEVYTRTSQG